MKKFFTSHFHACYCRTVWSFIFAYVTSIKLIRIPKVTRALPEKRATLQEATS